MKNETYKKIIIFLIILIIILSITNYITYESLKFEGEQASKCINTEETKGICPQGYSYNNQNNECVKVSDTGIGIT